MGDEEGGQIKGHRCFPRGWSHLDSIAMAWGILTKNLQAWHGRLGYEWGPVARPIRISPQIERGQGAIKDANKRRLLRHFSMFYLGSFLWKT